MELGTPTHNQPHPFIGVAGAPCDSCTAAEAHPLHITPAPIGEDPDRPGAPAAFVTTGEYLRLIRALEQIRDLPLLITEASWAANKAVEIARDTLAGKE